MAALKDGLVLLMSWQKQDRDDGKIYCWCICCLIRANSKPCFDERILSEVRDHDEIEMVVMPEGKTHLDADDAPVLMRSI